MHHNYHPSQITSDNTIYVPYDELDYPNLKELAKKRAGSYEEDNVERHHRGLKGEAAVAEAYSVELDKEIYENGDGGIDLTLKIHERERTVDVKTTGRRNPSLRIPTKGPKVCEIYILCAIRLHGVEILGWIPAEEALSMDNWRLIDGNGVFEIPIEDLNDPPIHPLRRR